MATETGDWRMMAVREVAEQLGIGERYLATLLATGKLRSVKQGRRRLIDSRDVEAYVEGLKEKSDAGAA